MKTSKDTVGTKLKVQMKTMATVQMSQRPHIEWLGLDSSSEIWKGECRRRPPNTSSEDICLAVGCHYLGCNFRSHSRTRNILGDNNSKNPPVYLKLKEIEVKICF